MRLLNSILETRKIIEIWKRINTHTTERWLAKISILVSRLCYAIFWFFDNLYILAKIKFLSLNKKKIGKISFFFWFLGLATSFTYNAVLLRLAYQEESILKITAPNNKTPKQTYQAIVDCSKKRKQIMLNLVRNLGDIIIAVQQVGISRKLFGININYGLLAVGGFTSSLVSMYQLHIKSEEQGKKDIYRYDTSK